MKTLSIRTAAVAALVMAGTLSSAHASPLDFFFSAHKNNAVGFATLLLSKPVETSPKFTRVAAPVYGERCVTRIGWCPIPPQPVGAPCMCGEVEGTTLQ